MPDLTENNIKSAKCPHCGEYSSKKHRETPKGKNIFVCTNNKCPKLKINKWKTKTGKVYFTDQKEKDLSESEKIFLTAILALIKMEISETNNKFELIDILSKINRFNFVDKTLQNLEFEIKSLTKSDINGYSNKAKPIKCYNPRVVICQDGDKISIIKLPVHEFKDASNAQYHELHQMISLENIPPENNKEKNRRKNQSRRPDYL